MEQIINTGPRTRTFKKALRKIVKPILITGAIFILLGGIFRFTPLGEKLPLPRFIKNLVVEDPAAKQAKETKELIDKISRHIVLPDEKPVVATIEDKDILVKEQQFYKDAANGDYLIIFPQAAKAIIYSKEKDVLVNVGPLIVEPQIEN